MKADHLIRLYREAEVLKDQLKQAREEQAREERAREAEGQREAGKGQPIESPVAVLEAKIEAIEAQKRGLSAELQREHLRSLGHEDPPGATQPGTLERNTPFEKELAAKQIESEIRREESHLMLADELGNEDDDLSGQARLVTEAQQPLPSQDLIFTGPQSPATANLVDGLLIGGGALFSVVLDMVKSKKAPEPKEAPETKEAKQAHEAKEAPETKEAKREPQTKEQSALEEKQAQAQRALEANLLKLEQKFEQNHADKAAHERQALLEKFQVQAEALRAELAKKQENERERLAKTPDERSR